MIEFLSTIDIAPTLAALYLLFIAFNMNTENTISSIAFKLVPFLIAMATLVAVADNAGYILLTP